MTAIWQTTRFRIDLSAPRIMGIVNATPDSFSDGGQHAGLRAQLVHCERLIGAGADIINDIYALRRAGATASAPTALDVAARHPACGFLVHTGTGQTDISHVAVYQGHPKELAGDTSLTDMQRAINTPADQSYRKFEQNTQAMIQQQRT
jgi:dihydropteroate synthase